MRCDICKEERHVNLYDGVWCCKECRETSNKDLIKRDMNDNINPNHYTDFAIPPNEYITANKLEWEVGNVIKYVTRYEKKNGLEDLVKAQKYIALLIERKYQ